MTNNLDGGPLIYVGFWRRLAAYAVDFAILIPYALLARQLIYSSRTAYLVNILIGTLIAIGFEVYLFKRLGGSPGKLLMRMRIAKLDGSPVGYRQASIRYSVLFVISMLTSAGLLLSFFHMSADCRVGLGMERILGFVDQQEAPSTARFDGRDSRR